MTTVTVPAEWSRHRAIWLGFPSHPDLWEADLEPARIEVANLARALAGPGAEQVRLLVCGEAAEQKARALLAGQDGVEFVPGAFGDIWLRDTGPVFFGPKSAAAFRFNGWGGKYILEGDEQVAGQIASTSGAKLTEWPFILEGGAVEHDGAGTILTTRQCLLNANRNAGWSESAAGQALAASLGARKVLWLDDGLLNDHTDGHIDNLARFIAPGVVACPEPHGADDPNAEIYSKTAERLVGMSDAEGRALKVVHMPSPGRVVDEDGVVLPASHMNFIIANGAVIMPHYDTPGAPLAAEALKNHFSGREIVTLPSRAILTGGGSFHCITQQEPA